MPVKLPYPAPAPTSIRLPLPAASAGLLARRRQANLRPRPGAGGWLLALLVLLLSGVAPAARAQTGGPPKCSEDSKFANTWYFGFKAGLDFNMATDSIKPTVLTDGAMDAPAGSGVMSDGSGKILFYSNGETVWNGTGSVMTNGMGLGGNRLTTDGPLPIRMPGSPPPLMPNSETRYLIFTQDAKGGPKGLSYSEIVIPAGGGAGTVVAATKNTPLAQGTAEKMSGVFHKNGCDIWVIVHGFGSAKSGNDNRGDAFLAYRVRPANAMGQPVIDPPIISTVGKLHVSAEGYRGQMKVTPDGRQLLVARYSAVAGDSSSTVELFSFDNNTGQVGSPRVLDAKEGGYYGVEFSPGRSRAYATVLGAAPRLPQLLQFDISGPGTGAPGRAVIPLKQTTPVNLGSMQAAPDGKIYVARENRDALGFIPYPDSLGAAIAYADDSLKLDGRLSGLGLVNFNQSSLLQFGFSGRPTACLEFTFNAPPVDFEPKTYAWDFGDGTTSSQPDSVKHVYARPGDYLVKLRVTTNCFCRESQSMVRIFGPPTPGTIAADQTVCAGDSVATLVSATPAGAGTGQYTYQWQSSPNGSTGWANVGTKSSQDTYAPGILATTTYFRRVVESGFCPPASPSNVVKITVLDKVEPGTIAADQTVCAGGPVERLTSTAAPTGGAGPGTFTFQWESSTDRTTFTVVPNATDATYAPGPLTVTTYFRRKVSSGPCNSVPSNVVTITVTPALTGGTIAANQPICFGAVPALLTSTAAATGGTGIVTYQWEQSADNTTFTPIPGATNQSYQPVALNATTYFRRRASSGTSCTPAVSNVVTITVAPVLVAGTIAADQPLCRGAIPAPLTSTGDASGGQGAPAYQWEFSTDNATFTPIPSATSASYSPGPLTVTTYYRRQARAGACGPATSNVVTLTVLPDLLAGIIADNQTICANTAPEPLGGNMATGGAGGYAYQWESSTNNTIFTAIGGETNSTLQPPVLTATTYFRRKVTSGTGTCSTAVSNVVTITVTPLTTPTVTLATPPTQCPGTPLVFTAQVFDAGPTPTFRWFVNNIPVASGPTFTSSTLVTGDQVRVEVTVTAGLCATGPATATVTVTRTPTPAPTLAIAVQPNAPVCAGEPLTFNATSVTAAGPNPVYQWLVNGTAVAGATGPVFTSTTLRDGQTVTLRLNTINSCGQALTAVSNGVVVRIQPPVRISAGPDKEIILGTSVILAGTADGNYPVTWTPATDLDFSGNDPLRPRASPKVTTTYTLSAGVGGCASTDEVTVTVREAIRIPNAFTPNGDGRDDTWQIEFIEDFPNNTVTVFNRWGNEVFKVQNYSRSNEWNGQINGKPAPVGTYYYVLVTKGPLGKSYSGSLTVLY